MLDTKQQIFEQIKKAQNILVAFSSFWNGDNIGSALAFYLFLKKMGKKADIISSKSREASPQEAANKTFSFLPGFSEIKRFLESANDFVISVNTKKIKVKKIRYKMDDDSVKFIIMPKTGGFTPEDVSARSQNSRYDLIITLDTPDLQSLGRIFEENAEFFYNTPIINIDHHGSNEEYGQINLLRINSVATAEILFFLFTSFQKEGEILVDENIATCLLAGIISKTKNFKTPNVTPDSLAATSSLISSRARREEIVNKLYRSRDINVLKLWGKVLSRLASLKNSRIVWSIVSLNDFLKTGTSKNDLPDIIEELIADIPEAKIIIIFYEAPGEKPGEPLINFMVHSTKNVNLMNLISEYNPKGDEQMVEIETKKNLEEIKNEIVELIDKKIGQLNF